MTGPSPIDNIREALNVSVPADHPCHAALTEVEQQLAEQKESIRSITADSGQVISRATARAVAAETSAQLHIQEAVDQVRRAVAAETALAEATMQANGWRAIAEDANGVMFVTRAEAAETALAEANDQTERLKAVVRAAQLDKETAERRANDLQERVNDLEHRYADEEQDADRLRDALREIQALPGQSGVVFQMARAALDRQEQR